MRTFSLGTVTAIAASSSVNISDAFSNERGPHQFAILARGTGTTPSWQVQVSMNGTDWINVGAIQSTTSAVVVVPHRTIFVRVNVTAGTGLNITFNVVI